MEQGFNSIVDDGQDESDSIQVEDVGHGEEEEIESGVGDSCIDLILLHFLKVQLREGVDPVTDLDDEVELEQMGHFKMRVTGPQGADGQQCRFSANHFNSPDKGDEVEDQQLATFVELGMFDLGKMELPIQFVQNVLLNDSMHHDTDQGIKRHKGYVLQSYCVIHYKRLSFFHHSIWRGCVVRHDDKH